MIKQMNISNEIEYNKIVKDINQRKILSGKKAGRHMIKLDKFEVK